MSWLTLTMQFSYKSNLCLKNGVSGKLFVIGADFYF